MLLKFIIRRYVLDRDNILNKNKLFKLVKYLPNSTGKAGTVFIKTLEESAYEPFSRSLRRGIPECFSDPSPCLTC
jgi:hypothetical protein